MSKPIEAVDLSQSDRLPQASVVTPSVPEGEVGDERERERVRVK